MQYGHCVVSATATAISSLYFIGIAPSATAALSKAQKAFITSGARLFIFFSLVRFSWLYINVFYLMSCPKAANGVPLTMTSTGRAVVKLTGRPDLERPAGDGQVNQASAIAWIAL